MRRREFIAGYIEASVPAKWYRCLNNTVLTDENLERQNRENDFIGIMGYTIPLVMKTIFQNFRKSSNLVSQHFCEACGQYRPEQKTTQDPQWKLNLQWSINLYYIFLISVFKSILMHLLHWAL